MRRSQKKGIPGRFVEHSLLRPAVAYLITAHAQVEDPFLTARAAEDRSLAIASVSCNRIWFLCGTVRIFL
jgi:hypothetical protein